MTRTIMLNVGPQAPAADRLRHAGLEVMITDDEAQIMNVAFGSDAERMGVEFGMNINRVLVPNEDRMADEIAYAPALILLGGVYYMQRRRRGAEPKKASAKA